MYRRQEVGRVKDWRCAAQVAGVQSQPMTRMAREPARGSRLSREANGWMICSQGQSSFARSWARLGCRVCGELQAVLRCDEDEKRYVYSGVDSGGNLYCNVECIQFDRKHLQTSDCSSLRHLSPVLVASTAVCLSYLFLKRIAASLRRLCTALLSGALRRLLHIDDRL